MGNGANTRQNFPFKQLFSGNNHFMQESTGQFSGLWMGRQNGTPSSRFLGFFASREQMLP